MDREALGAAVRRLREELERAEHGDRAALEHLAELAAELDRELGSEAGEADATLPGRVRDQIERFEVEHPRLTGILNDVMVALSNLGI